MKLSSKMPIGADQSQQTVCPELQRLIWRARQVKSERILRFPKLKDKTGRADSTIWKDIKSGTMPPPILIGARSVGWKESEIDAWIAAREFAHRSGKVIDMKAFVLALTKVNCGEPDDQTQSQELRYA